MKKLIDFDGLFDEKLAEYMEENASKYTEAQWETLIPKLYKSFGETFIKSAGNTPKGYYADMTDEELAEALEAHIREDVPVSDFLCREIESRRPEGLLRLMRSGDEQLVTIAVNLFGDDPRADSVYFDLLTGSFGADVKDAVAEWLKAGADRVKERALALWKDGVEKDYMLEILSRCKERDERVFETLLTAFRTSPDELPMYASYLANYGDERALPVLLEVIDRDDINFLEYQELKYAIEALGGEYTRERDFSEDPYYQEIKAQSAIEIDPSAGKH